MRFRKLRIAWSAGCAIACVLLIVLWVRSYYWDKLDTTKEPSIHAIVSLDGRVIYYTDIFLPANEGEDYRDWHYLRQPSALMSPFSFQS
jgi:hypothetical protein